MDNLLSAIQNRRSFYALSDEKIVPIKQIEKIVSESLKNVPTAFNSQSNKVVLLFNKEHKKLWDITLSVLKKIVPEKNFTKTEDKINTSFKNGYGTILYFEDTTVTESLQKSYPSYKDNFPIWSGHANAMLQFAIWTLLCEAGLGVSLQHYNPIIDEAVKKEWNIPSHYKLVAQMPFGKPIMPPDKKTFEPMENRLKVYK